MEWISTKERLPEYGRYVLIQDRNGIMCVGKLNAVKVKHHNFYSAPSWMAHGIRYRMEDIIAWQELPKVYKRKENGETGTDL